MTSAESNPCIDLLQAIADTKLILGHRFAQWTLAGASLEDDIGGAASAQEEVGHVRQLFSTLEEYGRDRDWLEGDRTPEEFSNASPLDRIDGTWTAFIATAGPVDRAAWYLLDSLEEPDMSGLISKIGEDEYFHLEYHDARIETLAEEQPDAVQTRLEEVLPETMAFLGPAEYDDDTDPLLDRGCTDRSVAELRAAFRDHYEGLFAETPVSLSNVDWSSPDVSAWDATRRRVGGGGIEEEDLRQIRGDRNAEFAIH